MKSFFQFLSESAAQQAARLGLEGDGHGGWYDSSTKEFVAKTEKGRLSPAQSELHKRLELQGAKVAVVRSEKDAIEQIIKWRLHKR